MVDLAPIGLFQPEFGIRTAHPPAQGRMTGNRYLELQAVCGNNVSKAVHPENFVFRQVPFLRRKENDFGRNFRRHDHLPKARLVAMRLRRAFLRRKKMLNWCRLCFFHPEILAFRHGHPPAQAGFWECEILETSAAGRKYVSKGVPGVPAGNPACGRTGVIFRSKGFLPSE